jgi:hypothetical protein
MLRPQLIKVLSALYLESSDADHAKAADHIISHFSLHTDTAAVLKKLDDCTEKTLQDLNVLLGDIATGGSTTPLSTRIQVLQENIIAMKLFAHGIAPTV